MDKKDAYELSIEISAAAMIIIGLSNQCSDECDRLTDKSLQLALTGVSNYLERIADDIGNLEINENAKTA